jgi:hypothetical protein
MYEWITQPQTILNILTAIIALTFGASMRTIRILKSPKVHVEHSFDLWLKTQSESLPIGLMALFGVPHFYPEVQPAEMLVVMLGVGFFSTEAFNFLKSKVDSTTKGDDNEQPPS